MVWILNESRGPKDRKEFDGPESEWPTRWPSGLVGGWPTRWPSGWISKLIEMRKYLGSGFRV